MEYTKDSLKDVIIKIKKHFNIDARGKKLFTNVDANEFDALVSEMNLPCFQLDVVTNGIAKKCKFKVIEKGKYYSIVQH